MNAARATTLNSNLMRRNKQGYRCPSAGWCWRNAERCAPNRGRHGCRPRRVDHDEKPRPQCAAGERWRLREISVSRSCFPLEPEFSRLGWPNLAWSHLGLLIGAVKFFVALSGVQGQSLALYLRICDAPAGHRATAYDSLVGTRPVDGG